MVVTFLAAIGAALSLTFVVVYVRRPWWRSHTGRIVMTTVAMVGVLLALRVAARTIVETPEWVWAAGYGLLDAGLFGLLWLLLRGEPPPPNG